MTRLSIKYRSFDPHEPRWVVRVFHCPGHITTFQACAPGLDARRDRRFFDLAEACDYARRNSTMEAP